jgi:DNA-binding MarR family transcriptional regulator
MNAVAFGAKRVFHGFLRVMRKPLASVGLTPARFDMLYAMFSRGGRERTRRSITQSALRRELGVCASVVSRMVRKLEQLRLVVRERGAFDRRQILIRLTDRGWERIEGVQRWLLRAVMRLVLEAICFGKHSDPFARLHHMESLEGYLRVLRDNFFDTATLYYSWGHPDD